MYDDDYDYDDDNETRMILKWINRKWPRKYEWIKTKEYIIIACNLFLLGSSNLVSAIHIYLYMCTTEP